MPLGTLGNPLIVCGLSDTFRGLSKRGRDTEFDAKIRQEEMRAFFSTNVPSTFPSEIDRMLFLLILLITSNGTVRFMRQPRFFIDILSVRAPVGALPYGRFSHIRYLFLKAGSLPTCLLYTSDAADE